MIDGASLIKRKSRRHDMDHVVEVGTSGWARFPEVVAYSDKRGITQAEAIRELVNCGLSHRPG